MKVFEDDGVRVEVPDDVYDRLVSLQKEREYLDKRQYALKIQQNSLYGALSNPHFRYFDPRLGNSTTGTGREVLMHITRKVGEFFDGAYQYPTPSSIYGDTDSSYFATGASTKEEAVILANEFANVVNDSMEAFMQDAFLCKGDYARQIKVAREVVADKAIFVSKKMYMLHLVDKKGKAVDDIKIMGLLLKKTLIPAAISDQITAVFEQLLLTSNWEEFNQSVIALRRSIAEAEDIKLKGLPKTVKNMSKYADALQRYEPSDKVPGHVRAAGAFNKALRVFNDTENEPIASGTKIKLYYLRGRAGADKAIALPTDIHPIPEWFIEHYVPYIDIEAQLELLVDAPIRQVLAALGKAVPTEDDIAISDSLVF